MPDTALSTSLKANCPRRDLFEAVTAVGKAVAARTSVPILTHVCLTADAGRLTVMGTDLEMWLEYTMATQSFTSSGAATCPARNLTELLGAMPEAEVDMSVDPETHALSLRCNRSNYTLLGLPADEFPRLPTIQATCTIKVDRAALRNAVKQTLFATSSDETRAILTGVLLVFQGEGLRLVATDTHRLALRDCPVLEGTGSASVIVPARAMGELQRMIHAGDGPVQITVATGQIQFKTNETTGSETTLLSRLIEGQFPNYERVIPTQATKQLTVQREPMGQAVRRAAIVARESNNRVVIRTTDDGQRLSISAESGSVGNAYEEVEVAYDISTGPVEIAFNAKYLSDVLAVLDGEGLRIELTESLRPGVVRPIGSDDYLCVLMPMQVV